MIIKPLHALLLSLGTLLLLPGHVAHAQAPPEPPAAAPARPPNTVYPPLRTAEITEAEMEAAVHHFNLAARAFAEGHYDVAMAEFTASYQLSRQPELLYNMGKTALMLQQRQVAIGYLREYVSTHPRDKTEVEAEIAKLSPAAAPPVAATPAAGAPAAGSPNLVAAVPSPATPASPLPRWLGWTLVGIGSGFLVTGAGLLAALAAPATSSPADQSQRRALGASGGVLGVAGAVLLTSGLVLELRKPKEAAPKLSLLPAGPGVQLVGSF